MSGSSSFQLPFVALFVVAVSAMPKRFLNGSSKRSSNEQEPNERLHFDQATDMLVLGGDEAVLRHTCSF